MPLRLVGGQHVAVDPRGVVGLELLGDRGQLRSRCRRPRSRARRPAAAPPGRRATRIARTSCASARCSDSVGGSLCRWRSVWRTTPAWVETWNDDLVAGADHHLGRAAADVEHERRRHVGRVALAGRAEERERRLLVAGQHVRLEAVAALDLGGELARRWPSRGPRWSAPRRRRRTSKCSIASRYSSSVANTRCIPSSLRRPSASTPVPSRVTRRAPVELLGDAAVVELGDQQAGRVRADVDDCLAHGHRTSCGIGLPSSAGEQVLDRERRHAARAPGAWPSRCGARRSGSARSAAGRRAAAARGRSRRARRRRSCRRSSASRSASWSTIGPAGGVDQDRGRPHLRERVGVDQVAGLGRQRAVERDEVRAREQLVEAGLRRGRCGPRSSRSRRRAGPPRGRSGPCR